MCVDLTITGSLGSKSYLTDLLDEDSSPAKQLWRNWWMEAVETYVISIQICTIRLPAQVGFLFTHANFLGLKSNHRAFDVVN